MDITININTDNAAFDDFTGSEIGEILSEIANGLRDKDYFYFTQNSKMPLLDLNGNTCGYIEIKESE